jgi:hypothetical protein
LGENYPTLLVYRMIICTFKGIHAYLTCLSCIF